MRSKVFKVRPNSPSLRGTIPQGIVEALKLNHGDEINWSIEIVDNKIIARVEKLNKRLQDAGERAQ